jgi:Xaa-Pro aminopeptidase
VLADLNSLLKSRTIDTLLVPMHEVLHPAFRWLTRGAKVTKGYAIQRVGEAPLLVTYPMERDEASATGLATRLVHDFDYDRIFKGAPNPVAAYGEFFDRVLRECGSGPSIAFAGNLPIHLYLGIADELQARGWNVVRAAGEDLVQLARKRKERWEIEAIASAGERTEQVVDRVREVLRAAVVEDDHVLYRGEVLTLGFLKRLVSSEIARLGMVEDHDTILSQGRDAAVPHSRGDASAPVRPSSPNLIQKIKLHK